MVVVVVVVVLAVMFGDGSGCGRRCGGGVAGGSGGGGGARCVSTQSMRKHNKNQFLSVVKQDPNWSVAPLVWIAICLTLLDYSEHHKVLHAML